MGYRVTHNSKKILHSILFLNLYLGLIFSGFIKAFAAPSTSVSVNVYLKFAPNNSVTQRVKQFNSLLSEKKILSRYHLTPFLQKHPLHITLYLANYNRLQLSQISKQVKVIAQHNQPIIIKTNVIKTSPSMYTMLFIIHNKRLQQLSDDVVSSLMDLRNKQATIPQWAQHDETKKISFLQFGSPNVFKHFSPHFSLFAAEHLTQQKAARLSADLAPLIRSFNNKKQNKVNVQAMAIGIGFADAQGQIVKELNSFPLG